MNNLSFKLRAILFFIVFTATSMVFAQDWDTEGSETEGTDPFGGDPFGGLSGDTSSSIWENTNPEPDTYDQGTSNSNSGDQPYSSSDNSNAEENNYSSENSTAQNAIIEGIQISTEKGQTEDEKIVSGYFIFRDKPTSYFYETKLHEKKMIFEFNDARVGSSPVPSVSEAPIKGFSIEEGKVDVNKAVRGLKPEWHDMIRITFDLDAVPEIHVNDEYSIVSFSFKWTSDPAKVDKYTVKDPRKTAIILSCSGVAGLGLGAAIVVVALRPKEPEPLKPLPISDLPIHEK